MIDVFIVGGGPAGATAARLLASWGWSVVVANRTWRGRPPLAESLPPSTKKLLAFLGQLEEVEARGFCPNAGNIAWWAGESRVTETDAPGLHVPRSDFDSVLRHAARERGALVLDAAVRRVRLGEPVQIDYVTTGGQSETCRARRVLDCSGRAGVIARWGFRSDLTAYRTLAITMEWEWDYTAAPDGMHTLVESYRDGWAWSVPLSDRRRQCTVMIDSAGRGERSDASSLERLYRRELAKARGISDRLARARAASSAWGCNASLYDAPRAAGPGALLVGDAASFIEPLSAAGVKKALASAWRAAVVTNTCLARPEMAGAATEFHVRREADVYAECRRLAGRFFTEAAGAYGHPFWEVRAEAAADQGGATTGSSVDELVRDPSVRAAFEELRRSPLVRLRPASDVRFEPTPVIEGREVVLRDGLTLPGARGPMCFAAGVNLPALVSLARRHDEMSSLISAYRSEIAPAPVDELLTGLSLLVAHRRLINEDSAP